MLTVLSTFCACLLGFAALAFSMDRHHGPSAHHRRRRWTRAVGVASMGASLLCAVAGNGVSQGILLWLGLLTPSALAVTAFLSCRAVAARDGPRKR